MSDVTELLFLFLFLMAEISLLMLVHIHDRTLVHYQQSSYTSLLIYILMQIMEMLAS